MRNSSRNIRTTSCLVGLAVASLLAVSGTAVATSSNGLVPPHGQVAGKGYGFWGGKVWQVIFESPAKPSDNCATVTVGGRKVAVVWPPLKGSGTYRQACTEPAGRPIYLMHVADECSTYKGDHLSYGTTDAQLKKCAHVQFKTGTGTTTIDGQSVPNMDRFIAASGVYALNLHKDNYFGYKRLHGRSAAYGDGVLLRGLKSGKHKVVAAGSISQYKFHWKAIYTITVQ
ncbi:MAG: hypothetical protein ACTHK4_15935 [Mycobacteriales bacterium]